MQIKQFAALTPEVRGKMYTNFVEAILDGKVDVKDFFVKKKVITETLDLIAKHPQVHSLIIDEIRKYKAEGGATALGAKLSMTSKGVYDYSKDPKWAEIKAQMKPLEEALKAQEELVKTATKNGTVMTDPDTGEVKAVPVPCPTTDSPTVKLPS